MEPCWQCGAPWRCSRCGSHEQRKGGKGCAECHRRANRKHHPSHPGLTTAESALFTQLLRDDFDDVDVPPAARRYLAAFEQHLTAKRAGDHRALRAATSARHAALNALEGPVQRRSNLDPQEHR